MSAKKFLLSFLAVGVVANVFDGLFYGMAMKSTFMAIAGYNDMSMTNPVWYIVVDFVMALLLTWYYSKARAGFSSGMMYGAMTALLISPAFLYQAIDVKGFPFYLCWVFILWTIVTFAIYGMILDMMNKSKTSA